MLYCPQCGADYREGYSSCSDCRVLLVRERLRNSDQMPAPRPYDDRRLIWRGVDQEGCVSVCYKLQDLDIVYRVAEKNASLGRQMRINRRYEIFVSAADYERAKSGLEIEDDPPETLSEAEWLEMEEPVDPDELQIPEGFELREQPESEKLDREDSLPDTPERRDAYFRYWYPEDATVQVWSQTDAEDWSGAIEMALKENLVHCRSNSDSGSSKAVFVMPEDESRAREIVRQIVESTPRK